MKILKKSLIISICSQTKWWTPFIEKLSLFIPSFYYYPPPHCLLHPKKFCPLSPDCRQNSLSFSPSPPSPLHVMMSYSSQYSPPLSHTQWCTFWMKVAPFALSFFVSHLLKIFWRLTLLEATVMIIYFGLVSLSLFYYYIDLSLLGWMVFQNCSSLYKRKIGN